MDEACAQCEGTGAQKCSFCGGSGLVDHDKVKRRTDIRIGCLLLCLLAFLLALVLGHCYGLSAPPP